MKKFVLFCLLVLTTANITYCAAQEPKKQKKLKIGMFIDNGSRGGGVLRLARLVGFTPQFELILLDGKDLREGKLSQIDMLLVPGGDSLLQYKAMQETGAQAVRDFVSAGGAYFGVCAGFHCAMNRPERIKLLPYGRLGSAGYQGRVAVEISEEGAKLLGVPKGMTFGYYSLGPISVKEKDWANSSARTLAVYKSASTQPGLATSKMFNSPAIIYGNHGKGNVVATSFHPESYKTTHNIVFGCINLVTGVKGKPVYPAKNRRPLRTAFLAGTVYGKQYIPIWLDLNRHADIDAVPVASNDLDAGALDHTDILVIPPGNAEVTRTFWKKRSYYLRHFMDKGGIVLSKQDDIKGVINHKNLVIVPDDNSFVACALQVR